MSRFPVLRCTLPPYEQTTRPCMKKNEKGSLDRLAIFKRGHHKKNREGASLKFAIGGPLKIFERGLLCFPDFFPTVSNYHDFTSRQIRLTFYQQGSLNFF